MNLTAITHEIYTSFMSVMILCGPILGFTGLAGLLIGLIQAVTQIQDQTLSQVLKLAVAALLLLTMGAKLAMPLFNHAEDLFKNFHMIVR